MPKASLDQQMTAMEAAVRELQDCLLQPANDRRQGPGSPRPMRHNCIPGCHILSRKLRTTGRSSGLASGRGTEGFDRGKLA